MTHCCTRSGRLQTGFIRLCKLFDSRASGLGRNGMTQSQLICHLALKHRVCFSVIFVRQMAVPAPGSMSLSGGHGNSSTVSQCLVSPLSHFTLASVDKLGRQTNQRRDYLHVSLGQRGQDDTAVHGDEGANESSARLLNLLLIVCAGVGREAEREKQSEQRAAVFFF